MVQVQQKRDKKGVRDGFDSRTGGHRGEQQFKINKIEMFKPLNYSIAYDLNVFPPFN